MNLKNSLNHISHKTIALFIITAFLLPSFSLIIIVAAEEQTYQNITIDTANYMIKYENKYPNLVILDVRTPCEFEKGHLYNAILIPHDELENRISELEKYKSSDIIVYCKFGGRSQQVSEIFIEYGFTKVYNMLGGIIEWVDAEYPIYTTYHRATIDKIEEELLFQIEPLIKSSYACCNEYQPNSDDIDIPSITLTVLEEGENYTEILITLEFEDTIIEGIIAETLLFHYEEFSDKTNRTVDFAFTEVTIEESFIAFYTMNYLVQDVDYNLTLYTLLTPLSSENYNVSSTIMSYEPADKSEVLSMEFVEFNFSTKLSEMYTILGKVAKKIGNVYNKSEDDTLKQLAKGYFTMKEEAKSLSKLVKTQLPEYDKPINTCSAILRDDFWSCLICNFFCGIAIIGGCFVACFLSWVFCPICVALLTYMDLTGVGCNIACTYFHWCP